VAASLCRAGGADGALALSPGRPRQRLLAPCDRPAKAGYRFARRPGRERLGPRPASEAVASWAKRANPGRCRSWSDRSGRVRLVCHTRPPLRARPRRGRDPAAAIAEGVLCLTAMETAVAAAEAIEDPDLAGRLADVRPSRVGAPGRARRPSPRETMRGASGRPLGRPAPPRPAAAVQRAWSAGRQAGSGSIPWIAGRAP